MKKGFTIIEVSLVLAIAGLIFLMVFVALPSLQRQQRDTERREDIIELVENIKKYQSNNRGAMPGSSENGNLSSGNIEVTHEDAASASGNSNYWRDFYKNYLGDSFVDPDGEYYKLLISNCGVNRSGSNCTSDVLASLESAVFPNDHKLIVALQSTCNGSMAAATNNPRKFAVLYRLESGGVYCSNS